MIWGVCVCVSMLQESLKLQHIVDFHLHSSVNLPHPRCSSLFVSSANSKESVMSWHIQINNYLWRAQATMLGMQLPSLLVSASFLTKPAVSTPRKKRIKAYSDTRLIFWSSHNTILRSVLDEFSNCLRISTTARPAGYKTLPTEGQQPGSPSIIRLCLHEMRSASGRKQVMTKPGNWRNSFWKVFTGSKSWREVTEMPSDDTAKLLLSPEREAFRAWRSGEVLKGKGMKKRMGTPLHQAAHQSVLCLFPLWILFMRDAVSCVHSNIWYDFKYVASGNTTCRVLCVAKDGAPCHSG